MVTWEEVSTKHWRNELYAVFKIRIGAAAQAGFQLAGVDLASGSGSLWSGLDLRNWESNPGTLHEFSWSN